MQTRILLDHGPVDDGGFLVHALLRVEGTAPDEEGRALMREVVERMAG